MWCNTVSKESGGRGVFTHLGWVDVPCRHRCVMSIWPALVHLVMWHCCVVLVVLGHSMVGWLTRLHRLGLVFKSPVKSGFLTPKGATVDRNQSKLLPLLGGPQPNRIGPVLFGSVAPQRPVGTGPNSYFYHK